MARMARVVVPFFPHHVRQRGNRRQQTFFGDDDYSIHIALMAESCRKAGLRTKEVAPEISILSLDLWEATMNMLIKPGPSQRRFFSERGNGGGRKRGRSL